MNEDVFTEPELDPHTLANLGPLTGMAGVWDCLLYTSDAADE